MTFKKFYYNLHNEAKIINYNFVENIKEHLNKLNNDKYYLLCELVSKFEYKGNPLIYYLMERKI